MAIAEAFCQGLPVVVSRVGAFAEIVEGGTTGLLFAPGDPDDLAVKVQWAPRHPAAMHAMGASACKAYEEKYSPAVSFHELTKIYGAASRKARVRRATQTQK